MIFSVCFSFTLNVQVGKLTLPSIYKIYMQTNPWGSNWKVFADFIEVCLLFIYLLLVYSLLLRCWGSSLEHFYFISPPAFCSASQKYREEHIGTVAEGIIFLCFVTRKTELWISWKCVVWAALCLWKHWFQTLIWDPWTLYLAVLSPECYHEIIE